MIAGETINRGNIMSVYVIVADSARARILSGDAGSGPLLEKQDLVHPESRQRQQDLVSDALLTALERGELGESLDEPIRRWAELGIRPRTILPVNWSLKSKRSIAVEISAACISSRHRGFSACCAGI